MNIDNVAYHVTTDRSLAASLAGIIPEDSEASINQRLSTREIGVLTRRIDNGRARPTAVIIPKDDQKRVFAKCAQVHDQFSPLSSWCHVLDAGNHIQIDDMEREPDFRGFLACWSGLVAAEATLLSGRPSHRTTLAVCLATQSFAIARASGLWGVTDVNQVLEKYDSARMLFNARLDRTAVVRDSLLPVWKTLVAAMCGGKENGSDGTRILVDVLIALQSSARQPSQLIFNKLALFLPESDTFERIDDLPASKRLAYFDLLVNRLRFSLTEKDRYYSNVISFICGYLVTIMAGGSASISVANKIADEFPQILAWSYVLGSVSEQVTWTSGFDGLGRVVSRELERAFRILEPPISDVSLNEAMVIVDKGLADPYVFLKLKGTRTAQIALYPGVSVSISVDNFEDKRNDALLRIEKKEVTPELERSTAPTTTPVLTADAVIDSLVAILMPKLQNALSGVSADDDTKTLTNRAAKTKVVRSKRTRSGSMLDLGE